MRIKLKVKSQKSKVLPALLAAAALSFAVSARAAVYSNASIIFPELENGAGARAAAIGGAYTAIADDAGAVYWNPAGLAFVKKPAITLTYDNWIVDSFFDNAMGAVPVGAGALGAEVFYMNFGSFPNVDGSGNSLSGSISPYTLAGIIAYGMDFGGSFSAGASAKVITQSQGSVSKTGFAGDLGLMLKSGMVSAGLAARNFGIASGSPLPSDINLGLAVNPLNSESGNLILAGEASYIFNDAFYASGGAEYTFAKIVSLRAGYKYRAGPSNLQGLSGISAGVGVKFGGIGFDYAFVPYGELGASNRADLRIEFGNQPVQAAVKEKEKEKAQPATLTVSDEKMNRMFFEAGTLENSGKLTEAADKYKEMLKADPLYAPAWKRLGAVFFKMKKKEQAIKCFESYLKIKPDDTAVVNWLKKNK